MIQLQHLIYCLGGCILYAEEVCSAYLAFKLTGSCFISIMFNLFKLDIEFLLLWEFKFFCLSADIEGLFNVKELPL